MSFGQPRIFGVTIGSRFEVFKCVLLKSCLLNQLCCTVFQEKRTCRFPGYNFFSPEAGAMRGFLRLKNKVLCVTETFTQKSRSSSFTVCITVLLFIFLKSPSNFLSSTTFHFVKYAVRAEKGTCFWAAPRVEGVTMGSRSELFKRVLFKCCLLDQLCCTIF